MGARDNICELPLAISIDREQRPSYTTFLRPCAYAAMIDTKVITRELRVHLGSDYNGDPERPTRSSHIAHAGGPTPGLTWWRAVEHAPGALDVRWSPIVCLYDHMFRIVDLFERLDHRTEIEVSDEVLGPFDALARGQSLAAGQPRPRALRSNVVALLGAGGLFGAPGERNAKA